MNVLELCGVKKGVNERINESTLRWFGHVERMNDSRLDKRMYSGECAVNRPAGRPKKKWIGSVKECLEERNVSLAEVRRKVHNRSEWQCFVRGYGCGPPGTWYEPNIDEMLSVSYTHLTLPTSDL